LTDESLKQLVKDSIWQAVQTAIKSNTINADRTLQARIISVEPNNKYVVSLQGAVYTVPCINSNTYAVNEAVWVTLPQGDYSSMYITGRRVS
jgi:hypothetical protein